MLAVLVMVIIFAHLTFHVVYFIYVEDYQSTNNWMVFGLSRVLTLALLIILPVIAIRIMPRLAIFDVVWFRWTRWEFLLFWLLPLVIYASRFILCFLAYKYELPIESNIFPTLSNSFPISGLYVWMTISGAVLFPIAEEIFWRGYVQSTLMRICHPAVAVLSQAVLFGLLHFRPLMGLVEASLFGLILGAWRYKRKTLLPVIIVHIVVNSAAYGVRWRDWLEESRVKVKHNYVTEFIEISKPAGYDPNDDAREEYANAGQLVVEFPEELKEVRKRYPTQWSKDERARAEAWVASNTDVLDLVEKGTQKPYYRVEYDHDGDLILSLLERDIEKIRHFAFALCLRAVLHTDQGRYEKGFNDVETCYKLGRHLAPSKGLLPQLIAVAVCDCAVQTVRRIVVYEDINPVLLIRLQRQLETFAKDNERGFDFTETRLIYMDVIQRIFTDDGHGGGHIPRSAFKKRKLPGGEFESVISTFASISESDIRVWRKLERHRTTAEVKRYYDLSEKACLVSPWEYNIDGNYIKITIENIENRNPLIKTFSPAIDRLVEIAARFRAEQDALIATLGILRYKADTQKLPRNLSELFATGYLKTAPDDPFSDGSITYRLTNKGFILYSFGADFDDDGGMPSKWGYGEKGGRPGLLARSGINGRF